MKAYLLVLLIAAGVTYLTTPIARWIALRSGAITAVRSRDVHSIPTPRLGGIAMLAGLAVAFVVASRIPFLEGVFEDSRRAWGILGAAAMVCLLGVADDIWDLDWVTKLIGQVLAAGFLAWSGVVLYQLPIGGVLIASPRLWLILTVLTVVVAMNAVNFVDGLDGLAAGMIAIGGTAFFVYSYLLTKSASPTDVSNLATLVIAVLVGACLGFLPHNFHPARIFMGDSGSMLIGLLIAAAPRMPHARRESSNTPSRNGMRLATTRATAIPASIAMPPSRGVGIEWTSRDRTAVIAPERSAIQRAIGVVR